MIVVKLMNGQIVTGLSFEEIVENMKNSACLQENKVEYMEGVSQRCQIYNEYEMSYSTPKEFIQELEKAEILVILFGREKL